MSARPRIDPPAEAGDGLRRLLATEEELAQRFAEARQRVEELDRQARGDAEQLRQRRRAALAQELEELRHHLESERSRHLAEIVEKTESSLERYRSVAGGRRLDRLAAILTEQFLSSLEPEESDR